jgi:flagellar biosynthetic protein FliO
MDALYVVGVFAKLIAVLVLFVGTALIARRWLGMPGATRLRRLKIIESLRLGPRQGLYLVRAGDQYLLVGATDGSIALVSTLSIDEPQVEETSQPANLPTALAPGLQKFQQLLDTYLKPGTKS